MSFFNTVQTLLKRKEHDEGGKDNLAAKSMINGNHGTIFGINKKIVVGIGICCATVFTIAFIFGTDNKTAPQKKQEIKQEANKARNPMTTDLEKNNYEALLASNSQKDPKKKNNGQPTKQPQQTQIPQQQPPQQYYNQAVAQNRQLNQIGQGNPYINVPAQAAPPPSIENVENRYKSPIAFIQSQQTSAQPAAAGASTVQSIDSSYVAPGEHTLTPGTIIPAVLMTGVNTDIEGQVIAQIQANVYDSLSGTNLLIPAGSRLLGTYKSGAGNESGFVAVTFNQLVMPNGGSYSLEQDSVVAMDGAGYVGLKGKVHDHSGKAVGSAAIGSALAALGSVAAGNTSNTSNTYSAGQLAMQGAMANMMNTASNIVQKGLNAGISITVKPGYQFNAYLVKGIVLGR